MENIEYSKWKDENRSILKSFVNQKILFGFSGGKDSSLALDFILRAKNDFGFDFDVHTGAFPIHRYTVAEKRRIGAYWSARGVDIIWHDFIETDDEIKNTDNPCLSCQKIRRRLLRSIITEQIDNIGNLVLITSYSLWDIVGYSLEHILAEIFFDSKEPKITGKSKRFIETAQRFYPLIKMNEGYTVYRPIIKYNGCDIIYTIDKIGIPVLSIPCDFREYRPKRILEEYYEKMRVRFDYNSVFKFAKTALELPDISVCSAIDKDTYLKEVF